MVVMIMAASAALTVPVIMRVVVVMLVLVITAAVTVLVWFVMVMHIGSPSFVYLIARFSVFGRTKKYNTAPTANISRTLNTP